MEELSDYHRKKIEKIIEENNISKKDEFIQLYMEKANTHTKITKEHLDEILSKYKMKLQEEKNDLIEKSLVKIPKIQDLGTNFFSYNNKQYSYIKTQKYLNYGDKEVETEEIWFKAKEIAEALGYTNPLKALRDHVSEKYQIKLEDLLKVNESFRLKKLKGNQKDTIYISEPGLYSLVFSSHKPEAIVFREFVFEQVLPSLRKYGKFSLNKDIEINFDTTGIKSFLKKKNLFEYDKYNVVYFGIVGIYNNSLLCKVGRTDCRITFRLAELQELYGPQFRMIAVEITDNNNITENLFKQMINDMNLNVDLTINGKQQTELFATNVNFTLDSAYQKLREFAEKNQSQIINDFKQYINYENTNVKVLLAQARIEKEKAKQKQEDRLK